MEIFNKKSDDSDGAEPPRIELKLRGFKKQTVISIPSIVRAIDILPSYHIAGLREIVYNPPANENVGTNSFYNGFIQGEFLQAQRKIIIYNISDVSSFLHVLYHEIGHFVFFLAFSSVLKKRWVTEIYPGSECLTEYGKLNAAEDFAECYASYLTNQENMQLVRLKLDFFRECVFSGRPHTLKELNA